ncbi:unnamed protein product [Peniophora sp. CBMAI 1063]|nr:unnamed protein product [Peniophora sp. CBMAI 1063]
MVPVDPTYPLHPVVCIVSSAMLVLVLLTSFIRQSWNLGVAFLCFWVLLENLTLGVNGIIWADNYDVRLYVYCDIVSHVQTITFTAKSLATLIITRRLHLITSLQSVELPDKAAKRRNLAIEWTLGLVIPVIVAGPLYTIVQQLRFEVNEGFGCGNSIDGSILSILLLPSWPVIAPLMSIILYYPHVVKTLYRQNRDINHFLRSNSSVSRTNYLRIVALASIDILLTLPIGIATIILTITEALDLGPIPFYYGWTRDRTGSKVAVGVSYADLVASGRSTVVQIYFQQWVSSVLAITIFCLFGVTSEARASYWRTICAVGGWFGWKPTPRVRGARSPLGDIGLNERNAHHSISLGLESYPSYVDPNVRMPKSEPGGAGVQPGKQASEAVRRADSFTSGAEHPIQCLGETRRPRDDDASVASAA